MKSSFESVLNFFEANEWKHEPNYENKTVESGMNCDNASLRIVVAVDSEYDLVQCIVPYQTKAPVAIRGEVAELICRINYGMRLGKYELDFSDGEIRFHLASVINPDVITEEIVRRLVHTSFLTADKYYPAFMKVMFGVLTPEDAVNEVEGERAATA